MVNENIGRIKEDSNEAIEAIQVTNDAATLQEESKSLDKKIHFQILWATHADEINAFTWFSWAKKKYEANPKNYKNINFHVVNEAWVKVKEEKRTRDVEVIENGKTVMEDPNRPSQGKAIKASLSKRIDTPDNKMPYFVDFHNCRWKYTLWAVQNHDNLSEKQKMFHINLAKSLWLDAIIFADPKISMDILKTVTESKWGSGMIIEVGNDIDKEQKMSLKIANTLLEISNEIHQDWKELKYIENIHKSWWNNHASNKTLKFFKVSSTTEKEIDTLMKKWYQEQSFIISNTLLLKYETSEDNGKTFTWITEEDRKIFDGL